MLTSSSDGCDRDGLFAAILFTAAAMVMEGRSSEERGIVRCGENGRWLWQWCQTTNFWFGGLCGCRIIGEGSLSKFYLLASVS